MTGSPALISIGRGSGGGTEITLGSIASVASKGPLVATSLLQTYIYELLELQFSAKCVSRNSFVLRESLYLFF